MIYTTTIDPNDLQLVVDYIDTIEFNTPENHVPLHDNLFNSGIKFDIHTRGEMPKDILNIFSTIGEIIYNYVVSVEDKDYHPPMFSKNYIARYRQGIGQAAASDPSKPKGTYKAYVFWQFDDSSNAYFPDLGERFKPENGSLIIYEDIQSNRFGFDPSSNAPIYISEFWLSPVGTAPFTNVDYGAVDWNDWEIRGF